MVIRAASIGCILWGSPDADAGQREPSYGKDNGDGGSPYPEDAEFCYARPDAVETEEAISKCISLMIGVPTLLSPYPMPPA